MPVKFPPFIEKKKKKKPTQKNFDPLVQIFSALKKTFIENMYKVSKLQELFRVKE